MIGVVEKKREEEGKEGEEGEEGEGEEVTPWQL